METPTSVALIFDGVFDSFPGLRSARPSGGYLQSYSAAGAECVVRSNANCATRRAERDFEVADRRRPIVLSPEDFAISARDGRGHRRRDRRAVKRAARGLGLEH